MTTSSDESDKGQRAKRKPRKRAAGQVIHVAFGPGGGRIDPKAAAPGQAEGARETAGPRLPDAVTDLFSKREVAKLLGLSEARLRTLDRAEIVSPSGERNGKRAYTFQDLIALRATLLLAQDVKLRDVALAIGALRKSLPRVTRPLQELRIVSDGRRVVVRTEGTTFEPLTGQTVMDFQVNALEQDVVRVLRPESLRARLRTAYDLYTRASALDEDPSTFDEAEALYQRAIDLDPQLAIAYTNLGNIRFRRGDEPGAVELYEQALAIDERQPEAHYNLGYVKLERGQAPSAVSHFERALESDPRFADAHFNLAMALEQAGEPVRARPHWRRYLELEPTGTWADIARQHL
jgi:tetratricopeptide (TPR) repeat protein